MSPAPPLKRHVPLHGLFRCFPFTWKCLIACYIAFIVFNALIALSANPALAFAPQALQPLADWLARFVPAVGAVAQQLANPRDFFMLVPITAQLAGNMLLSLIFVISLAIAAWIDLTRNPAGVRDAVNDVVSRTTEMPETSGEAHTLCTRTVRVFMFGIQQRLHDKPRADGCDKHHYLWWRDGVSGCRDYLRDDRTSESNCSRQDRMIAARPSSFCNARAVARPLFILLQLHP